MPPAFSIIMATYNRGRHIRPTIRSVLGQTFTDHELLIIGDACDDDTAAIVAPFVSGRVKWLNLPKRAGNQHGPNNAGLRIARGRYIAYLGHDDLWTPDHLAALRRVFVEAPGASFAVSGCVCYGPPGSGFHMVTGLFDSDEAKFKYFFPPSSFAHKADVIARIGPWKAPETMKRSVDADLLLRGAEAGLLFASTGEITVHKFAAGGRHLSYTRHGSEEQELIARMMPEPGFGTFVAGVVARARETGRYGLKYPDYERVPAGHYHTELITSKGILRPALLPLDGKAVMPQSDDNRSLDWRPITMTRRRRIRWSGPNPRPRLLIPFHAAGRTRLRFVIYDASDQDVIGKIRLTVNQVATPWRFCRHEQGSRQGIIECLAELPGSNHTVVEFDLSGGASLEELLRAVAGRPERIALGEIHLRPRAAAPGRRLALHAAWQTRIADAFRQLTKH